MADEWSKYGIRANIMTPGIVEPEGITAAVGSELPDVLLDDLAADRFGTPADCVY